MAGVLSHHARFHPTHAATLKKSLPPSIKPQTSQYNSNTVPNIWHKKHFAHNADTMAAMHANFSSRRTIPLLGTEPLSE